MEYQTIVFQQGEDADEALGILDQGRDPQAAIRHLAQWDYGDAGETRSELGAGTDDDTYEWMLNGESYVLTYNTRLGYIGLDKIV